MLDLRTSTGWFFTLFGAILAIQGVIAPHLRAALTDVNVNLYCGLLMLAFGGMMLLWSRIRL